MTDKLEPTAEHIDAVARAIDEGHHPYGIATTDCHDGVRRLLTSTDPAVHAALAANLPTDAMLTALVERGALTWQHDDREWRGDPGLIPRGRNNGVRWAACRVVSAWEPDEATP